SISSPTTAISATSTPSAASRRASQLPFVFSTSPASSSFPTVTIAARAMRSEYTSVLEELLAPRERECRLVPELARQTLAAAEAAAPDDLILELGLERRQLKALRAPLERCGVVVGRWEDEHNVLYRWDQLGVEPGDGPPDLAPLVVAAVEAAVVVPEREP